MFLGCSAFAASLDLQPGGIETGSLSMQTILVT